MKPTKILTLSLFSGLIMLLMSSCNEPVKALVGSYSYTISGQATIEDTISVILPNEKGAVQMEKIQKDSILLTMNYYSGIEGGVYTTQGKVTDNKITLTPFKRIMTVTYKNTETDLLIPVEKTYTENYEVQVSGVGTIYNETVHFQLQYNGKCTTNNKVIKGNNILMVAKRN